ncbi:MAG: histidine kinase, partial [Chloroflexi bacterium]|nr:histidine kinase [Chloroflexota bacterium]
MESTTTVRQVLEKKGYDIWWIDPDATVYEALELMAE